MHSVEKSTFDSAENEINHLTQQRENGKQKAKGGRRKKLRTDEEQMEFDQNFNQNIPENTQENLPESFNLQNMHQVNEMTNDLNQLNDGHFSNFLFKREKIMSRLYKDQMQVMNPALVPFYNLEHAKECLIPYHIYNNPSYDDLIFELSPKYENLLKDVENVTNSIYNTLNEHEMGLKQNIVMDLLLTEEQKYIVNKYGDFMKNRKKKTKPSPRPAPSRQPKASKKFIDDESRYKVKLKTKGILPTETLVILRPEPTDE